MSSKFKKFMNQDMSSEQKFCLITKTEQRFSIAAPRKFIPVTRMLFHVKCVNYADYSRGYNATDHFDRIIYPV